MNYRLAVGLALSMFRQYTFDNALGIFCYLVEYTLTLTQEATTYCRVFKDFKESIRQH